MEGHIVVSRKEIHRAHVLKQNHRSKIEGLHRFLLILHGNRDAVKGITVDEIGGAVDKSL